MAAGIPVVTFNVWGIPDIIRYLETGYLVLPGDADGLVQAMRLLLTDSELRLRLARNARTLVEEEHCIEKYTWPYLALYEEVLESARKEMSALP